MFIFWGIRFFPYSAGDVIRKITYWIEHEQKHYICVTSLHGLVASQFDKDLFKAHSQSGLTVPDGVPLVWIGKLLGYRKTSRIYGPDLFLLTCKELEKKSYGVFLYGTTKRTLEKLKMNLQDRFPKLNIVGDYSPPFHKLSTQEEIQIRGIINKARPHVVWVGLSTPKQEEWMARNIKYLNTNVLIGVGAAFDFIAGNIPQAPSWMQKVGLEWFFRLIQEPKRLWRRYLKTGLLFIYLLIKYSIHDER